MKLVLIKRRAVFVLFLLVGWAVYNVMLKSPISGAEHFAYIKCECNMLLCNFENEELRKAYKIKIEEMEKDYNENL